MAYPVNPNVFSGGAVVVNTTPFAQFYMQQQAKRQAKTDALNKYYDDQMKALTPTGMRAKDIENGWSQKFSEWQKMGIEKKKALLNPASDNYQTINEFNRLANELKSDIEKSKEMAEAEKQLREAKMNGKWNPTDDDLEIANDISKPIYAPDRKGLSLAELSVNTPPLNVNEFLSTVASGKKREKKVVGDPVFDAKRGVRVLTMEEAYSPDQLKAMADSVPHLVQNNRSARVFFQHALESNDLPNLQKAYNALYPGLVDTPEKAAQAFTIMQNQTPTGRSTEVQNWTDPNADEQKQMRLIRAREESRKRVDAAKSAGTASEAKGVLNQQVNELINESKKNPWRYFENGKEQKAYNVPLTEDVAKAAMLPGESQAPDQLLLIEKDGKPYIKRVYFQYKTKDVGGKAVFDGYKTNSEGKFLIDKTQTKDIPIGQFKNQWAKNLYSGKILQGEQGEELDIDDVDFDDEQPSPRQQRPQQPQKTFKLSKGSLDDL